MFTKKVRHIATALGLLLCITLSFAWMTELDEFPSGRYLEIHYDNSLYSAAVGMDASLYVLEEQDGAAGEVTYKDITKQYKSDTDELYSTENFAPGQYKLFALKMQNKTTLPMNVSVNLAKIEGDPLFLEHMNLGILDSTGFTGEYEPPKVEEFPMAERANGNGAVTLANLLLPPTGDASLLDNVVEIRFYVRFSHTAVNELQDKEFKIGVVNVMAA